ncbi:MAG: hypothetical protein RR400_01655 [Clostridia bacterium]
MENKIKLPPRPMPPMAQKNPVAKECESGETTCSPSLDLAVKTASSIDDVKKERKLLKKKADDEKMKKIKIKKGIFIGLSILISIIICSLIIIDYASKIYFVPDFF